jgi:hypothetical protein
MTTDGVPTTAMTISEVETHQTVAPTDTMQISACPECGLAAESVDAVAVASTSGPVDLVRLVCIQRHWFVVPSVAPATRPVC